MFSKLVNDVRLSPNCSSRDGRKINRITIHHTAGVASVDNLLWMFAQQSRGASANYVIGNDGQIGGCCPEELRSWCSGSWDNDTQAITIEVSNSASGEPWPVGAAAWNSMIRLCVDICRRYGFRMWTDKDKKTGSLTAHRWYQATACPGTYLYERFELICKEVNRILDYDKKVDDLEKTVDALTSVVGDLKKTVDAIDITLEAVKQQSAKTAEEVLPVYKNLDAVPNWYHDAVETLVKSGAIQGVSSTDLHVNQLMARIFTILEREGIL